DGWYKGWHNGAFINPHTNRDSSYAHPVDLLCFRKGLIESRGHDGDVVPSLGQVFRKLFGMN
ncbi:MAG: hypothetical protein P8123_02610, partial [bacterium]